MKRFEYKYLLPNTRLQDVRRLVQPFVKLDAHAQTNGGQYTVRSIYFDSPGLTNYHQKIEGLKMRRKLRMRGYNDGDANSTVFLEIKRRYGIPIAKNRTPLPYHNASLLLGSGEIEALVPHHPSFPKAHADAERFLYNLHRFSMRPMVNVIYDREAYVGRLDPTVRVTLDKNLRGVLFPGLSDLFSDQGIMPAFAEHFILEIKFYGSMMPVWGRTLVRRLDIRQRALSKYTICLDAFPFPKTTRYVIAHSQSLAALYQHVRFHRTPEEALL